MNKNIVIGGGIVIALIAVGLIIYSVGNGGLAPVTSTSTPVTSTATTVLPGDQTGTTGTTAQNPTPGAPKVVTGTLSAPTETTMVVSGNVVPNGAFTSYWYEYGTTQSLGMKTISQSVGSGYVSTAAPMYITGLTKDTSYYYRLVASNQYGTTDGAVNTFQTTHGVAAPVGSIPAVSTIAASGITRTASNLNGYVTPNKAASQYWFEYGTTANLGNVTPLVSVGSGSTRTGASASLTDLAPGTTYYFRLDAQNEFGTVNGGILSFKTTGPVVSVTAPVVTTQVANAIAATGATLRGTVNPYGTQTTYWFEYSTNSGFASNTLKSTSQKSTGAVSSTLSVTANVNNLASKTTYYYRIVAENSSGTVRGAAETFKTI